MIPVTSLPSSKQHSIPTPKLQNEQSKNPITQERQAEKLKKLQYKGDLDKQLNLKKSTNPDYPNISEDHDFLTAQILAFKTSDMHQKLEKRNYHKTYQDSNSQALQAKYLEQQTIIFQEKEKERLANEKLQQELENIKNIEKSKKHIKAQEEKLELQKIMQEKIVKSQQANAEKARDYELAKKKAQEMKASEERYKEFYNKRMKDLDERLKYFKPSIEIIDRKIELIKKRCEEWQKRSDERFNLKEKYETESKKRIKNKIKDELFKQIEFKNKAKELEYLEGIKYQKLAQQEALEERYKMKLKRDQLLIEQNHVRKYYDRQIRIKQSNSLPRLKGENRNWASQRSDFRVIDSINLDGKFLRDLSTKSTYKKPFQKVFPNSIKDLSINTSFSPDKNLKAYTNKTYDEASKGKRIFDELTKHNPITNPIGSIKSRVLQGQRVGKGYRSQSKLRNSIKDVFNHI